MSNELDYLRDELKTNFKWQSLRGLSEGVIEYRRLRFVQIAKRMWEITSDNGGSDNGL